MMLTRCPSCHTAFRVTPEQLKARAGKVRCGHCNATFNALETLEEGAPATPPAPTPVEETTFLNGHPEAEPLKNDVAPYPEESAQESNDAFVAAMRSDEHITAISVEQPRPARWRIAVWSLAPLALAMLLGAQTVYAFRTTLALSQPAWRPTLAGWCATLGCDLPLPHQAELVGIESSDLHPDPQAKNLLVLSATIKNRAAYAQAYPYLELTLTDTRDQPLARRVFLPADYVDGNERLRSGLAQNVELPVNLWLDATSVPATGYRLYLFYP